MQKWQKQFYNVFAIFAQAIRFSKLPIKPSGKNKFSFTFCMNRERKCTFFILNQTEKQFTCNWKAKSHFLFLLPQNQCPEYMSDESGTKEYNCLGLATCSLPWPDTKWNLSVKVERLEGMRLHHFLWKFLYLKTQTNRGKNTNIINPCKLQNSLIKSSRGLTILNKNRDHLKTH